MSILDQIIAHKREELIETKAKIPSSTLEQIAAAIEPPRGLALSLQCAKDPEAGEMGFGGPAIIAEIKRASPSKGIIRADLDPVQTAMGYAKNGARGLSVLTESKFFSGNLEYISQIRQHLDGTPWESLPILRKDFIIDPYQVLETRAAGADALLLIVAGLSEEALDELLAASLHYQLDVLIEVHDEPELEIALEAILVALKTGALETTGPQVLLGINNRNLKTFVTDLATTKKICGSWRSSPAAAAISKEHPEILSELCLVAESGIFTAADLALLESYGANSFLIGESLVASGDPGQNLAQLISDYRKK